MAALPDDFARPVPPVQPAPPVAESALSRAQRVRAKAKAFFLLTNPPVIELLLVTTVPAMILAEDGLPRITLILSVLLGGAMAAGGANTINCWIERDRDQVMRRTHAR